MIEYMDPNSDETEISPFLESDSPRKGVENCTELTGPEELQPNLDGNDLSQMESDPSSISCDLVQTYPSPHHLKSKY